MHARDLRLDDAGVAGNVIDVMVAKSYPDKFQVERRSEVAAPAPDPMPLTLYPYFFGYPGYYPGDYVNYRYSYGPFGYSYYDYFYYPGPIFVGGGDNSEESGGDGRVVNGVGYTRVRTREAERREADSGTTESSGARSRMTSSGATQSSSGASSGSGTASSRGSDSSSSSGGSDTGGTAQPR